jgi:hypothetical protein
MPALPAARAGERFVHEETAHYRVGYKPRLFILCQYYDPSVLIDGNKPLGAAAEHHAGPLVLPAGLHGDYAADDDIGSFPESLENIRFGLKFTLDDGAFQYAIEDRTQAVDTHHHRWK